MLTLFSPFSLCWSMESETWVNLLLGYLLSLLPIVNSLLLQLGYMLPMSTTPELNDSTTSSSQFAHHRSRGHRYCDAFNYSRPFFLYPAETTAALCSGFFYAHPAITVSSISRRSRHVRRLTTYRSTHTCSTSLFCCDRLYPLTRPLGPHEQSIYHFAYYSEQHSRSCLFSNIKAFLSL